MRFISRLSIAGGRISGTRLRDSRFSFGQDERRRVREVVASVKRLLVVTLIKTYTMSIRSNRDRWSHNGARSPRSSVRPSVRSLARSRVQREVAFAYPRGTHPSLPAMIERNCVAGELPGSSRVFSSFQSEFRVRESARSAESPMPRVTVAPLTIARDDDEPLSRETRSARRSWLG